MYKVYTINYCIIDTRMIIYTHFNGLMELFYKLMEKIETLEFEEDQLRAVISKFNQRIMLTKNIKVVIFGVNFNNHLVLNKNVITIKLGALYNRPFDLTKCVKHLNFRGFFNKPIQLSKNIYFLGFGFQFNNHLILPKKLKYLTLGWNFETTFVQPKYLKIITFNYGFNCSQKIIPRNYHLMDRTYDIKIVCVGTNHYLFDNLSNSTIIEIHPHSHTNSSFNNMPNDKKKIYVEAR